MNYLIWGLIAAPLFSNPAIAQPVTYSASIVYVEGVQVVANRAPEKASARLTDFIFYNLHSELNRRKIRSDETQYIKEWAAIPQVMRDNWVYEPGCNRRLSYDWLISVYDGQSSNELILFIQSRTQQSSGCCILHPSSRIELSQNTT